jgi:hypothetical protein
MILLISHTLGFMAPPKPPLDRVRHGSSPPLPSRALQPAVTNRACGTRSTTARRLTTAEAGD